MKVAFVASFAIVVLLVGISRGRVGFHEYFDLLASQDVLDHTITKLEQENEQLTGEIHKLKSSKNYAKKVLRDKYHLTDENENIVFFSD